MGSNDLFSTLLMGMVFWKAILVVVIAIAVLGVISIFIPSLGSLFWGVIFLGIGLVLPPKLLILFKSKKWHVTLRDVIMMSGLFLIFIPLISGWLGQAWSALDFLGTATGIASMTPVVGSSISGYLTEFEVETGVQTQSLMIFLTIIASSITIWSYLKKIKVKI